MPRMLCVLAVTVLLLLGLGCEESLPNIPVVDQVVNPSDYRDGRDTDDDDIPNYMDCNENDAGMLAAYRDSAGTRYQYQHVAHALAEMVDGDDVVFCGRQEVPSQITFNGYTDLSLSGVSGSGAYDAVLQINDGGGISSINSGVTLRGFTLVFQNEAAIKVIGGGVTLYRMVTYNNPIGVECKEGASVRIIDSLSARDTLGLIAEIGCEVESNGFSVDQSMVLNPPTAIELSGGSRFYGPYFQNVGGPNVILTNGTPNSLPVPSGTWTRVSCDMNGCTF